jgi:hypothetical protein
MGGGLMQLVAYGAQDIYLTGNPQITFFKVVYRRHTNFSMEAIQQTLNGSIGANGSQTCTISRNGDLVGNTFIELDLNTNAAEGKVYELVDNVEVEIGGQRIDRHHGDWNAIWWELSTPESKVNALKNLLTQQTGYSDATKCSIHYPLNFWFCRNPGLALPLIALQYHEVKLKITWGDGIGSSDTAKVWCDYIYLDTDERRRFAQVSHEYLIEQVQRETSAAASSSVKLNFNHPVKELIWVVSPSANSYGTGCRFVPLNNADNITSAALATHAASTWHPTDGDNEVDVKLQLNGHDRMAVREAKYFQEVQPYQFHTRVPNAGGRTHTFDWGSGVGGAAGGALTSTETTDAFVVGGARKPMRYKGGLISTAVISGNTPSVTVYHGTTGGVGHTTTDVIDLSADAATLTGSTPNGTAASAASSTLNVGITLPVVAGAPLGTFADNLWAGGFTGVKMSADAALWVGSLSLNYDELPTLIAGDGDDTSNINVYSFALKPEEHQPSGTCNFSRIDNAKLMTGSGNFNGNASAQLKVFAVNYNVLRIMSGMGGLAYSN